MEAKHVLILKLQPEDAKALYRVIGHISDTDFKTKFSLSDSELEIIHELCDLTHSLNDDD